MPGVNLRKAAADRSCQIRLADCTEQASCLAHWRQMDISGMGMKSPDLIGAWACDACHNKVDSTERGNPQTQLDFARGVFRTQAALIREGVVSW